MVRTYAKRLLSPFVGLVHVAETNGARALTLDGRNWAVQYSLAGVAPRHKTPANANPGSQFSLVATIDDGRLRARALHPFFDPVAVRTAIEQLFEAVTAARLPFGLADRYEYWLLDDGSRHPLALIHSCVDEHDMAQAPRRPVWMAMPAAQLHVPSPDAGRGDYVPPVNYRLQKIVEERAGARPRAAWFERAAASEDAFPPCLIREDWQDRQGKALCDLYVCRLAPRLLMLQNLSRPVRRRLERAACAHALDVERFYPLYPEVVDDSLLTAARIEARLRRVADVKRGP